MSSLGSRIPRGEYLRRSLDLVSWQVAQDRVRGWEASGEVGIIRADIPGISDVDRFFERREVAMLSASLARSGVRRKRPSESASLEQPPETWREVVGVTADLQTVHLPPTATAFLPARLYDRLDPVVLPTRPGSIA